jgi:flagellar hook-associated protein 3 FlgL
MRIDSLTYFTTSLSGMRENQTSIARLNEQIATGKRLLAPKDDPLATEKVLQLSNRVATRSQHVANQDRAEITLKYQQTVVQEVQKSLKDARALLSISPSSSQDLRNIHAEQLKGTFKHILGLLNTQDPGGNYIFAGFKTNVAPFANTSLATSPATVEATTYNGGVASTPGGDDFRYIEVEEGRTVQVSDNLSSVVLFTDGSFNDPANEDPTNTSPGPLDQHDLLENLAHAITNLPTSTITVDQINRYATLITKTLDKLALVEHRIAGAMSEVIDARNTTKALLLQERNALSDIQQVDQAAAIMELQLRQTALEAAGRAYARTSGLSLFNFIG